MLLLASILAIMGYFLRVFLFALLVVATCCYPQKGSQSTGPSSSGAGTTGNYGSYQGGGPSFAAAPYTAVGGGASGPTFVQGAGGYQPVLVTSGIGGSGAAAVGVPAAGLSPVGPAGQASVFTPGLAGYVASPSVYVPVAESSAGPQDGPATEWSVPTTTFSEGGSPDIQPLSVVLPPAPSTPRGPTLTSGELSRVEKEAELGNYQQQTEDFGYPAVAGSGQEFGQGLTTVLMPGVGLGGAGLGGAGAGGFRPVSPGNYDWLFLYGLLPPGLYSTFSQHHEAGKDYSQAIHYLKEHVTDGSGSGQQKKFF